jgi:hypothetical protein
MLQLTITTPHHLMMGQQAHVVGCCGRAICMASLYAWPCFMYGLAVRMALPHVSVCMLCYLCRYDKMSARELFRQWGVSQRCYEEVGTGLWL